MRLYATGKLFAFVTVDDENAELVTAALGRSIVLDPRLDEERFVRELEARGIPRWRADGYIASVVIDDETWLQEKNPF
jgi:hypothetical protein